MDNKLKLILGKNVIQRDKLLQASAELSRHMKNPFFFNPDPYIVHREVRFNGAYRTKNLRQLFFDSCIFENADFYQAGLAGSSFVSCSFSPCNFYDTNFQSCDFRNCNFSNIEFKYTRFNKSILRNVEFYNCKFTSVSFNDAVFDSCKFINCEWHPISIENAIFRNTLLQKLIIRNMNFEFATFENIKTIDVKLPFPTIPFIFKGLNYIAETSDNIRLTSAENPNGITAKEYLDNIPNMITFFKGTLNYFPLVNIFIMQEKFQEALNAIYEGLKISITLHKFRLIKYFCRQLNYIKTVTNKDKQALYQDILLLLSKEELLEHETDSLKMYLPEVRQLLITDDINNQMQLVLQTNIISPDYKKLSFLLKAIDNILSDNCQYTLQLRHNSPFWILIDILADPSKLSLILSAVSVALGFKQLIDSKKINDDKIDINNQLLEENKNIKNDNNDLTTQDDSLLTKHANINNELSNNQIVIENMTIINNGRIIVKNKKSKRK